MIAVYSSSDSYAEIAGLSICSLCETNRGADTLLIYMLDHAISALNKQRLEAAVRPYGRELRFVEPPDIEKLLGIKLSAAQWNISTYSRLFLCSILPEDIGRVLYIDCDTLVCRPLYEMWRMDLGECAVAAVDDCRHEAYRLELGLRPEDSYTNSGVLIIDLDRWRALGAERQFADALIAGGGAFPFVDQGVMNAVLARQGLIRVIPPKYNAMTLLFTLDYESILAMRSPARGHMTRAEYDEAVSRPVIVHFTPLFLLGNRPWHGRYTRHPYGELYRKYKAASPWRDEPYRPNRRTLLRRAATWVCAHMPRPWMVCCVSLLYARIIPRIKARRPAAGRVPAGRAV